MTADLANLPPITHQRGGDPELLFAELKGIIATAITNHPRSQQKRIGPSEIGDPCARKLAYKVTGVPEARTLPPGWRPTVGTATHSWLAEECLASYNIATREDNGASRFLIEQRINAGAMAGTELTGSTDWYDRVTATVGDWKIIGPSSHKKLATDLRMGRKPKVEYVVQLQTYGLGWLNRGLPVDTVMLVALPSAGELDDALVWHEPFDPMVAQNAMRRVDRIHALVTTLGATAYAITNGQLAAAGVGVLADPDGMPDALAIAPDEGGCRFCPWLLDKSENPATACPGGAAQERNVARQLEGLIA